MKSMVKKNVLSFFCLLLLFSPGCKFEDPGNFDTNGLIILTRLEADAIRADGISTTTFSAQIPADASERTVAFKTTAGSFISAAGAKAISVIADADGIAEATLKVGITPGKVEVTATIGGYTAFLNVEFKTAHADTITGETSTFVVTKSGSVRAAITAFLSRKDVQGAVSVGTDVEFFAYQMNDQNQEISVGRFLNGNVAKTNDKGIATITYSADAPEVVIGIPLRIEMVTSKDNDEKIRHPLWLNVIE